MGQKKTSAWIERHWGDNDNAARVEKLLEEVAELTVALDVAGRERLKEIFNRQIDRATLSPPDEEFGDVLIVLEHLATRYDINLNRARDRKMKATQIKKGKF